MSSDDELWKSGKSDEDAAEANEGEDSTLDLSSPSPDDGGSGDLDLSSVANTEAVRDDENWKAPLPHKSDEISIRTIGIVGTITILLLTGVLYFLLIPNQIEISVPYENYGEEITYNVEGTIDFESSRGVPLPLGFFDNEVIINELSVTFLGNLIAGTEDPKGTLEDGYGNDRTIYKKYIEQNLKNVNGSITEKGLEPTDFTNAEVVSKKHEYIDTTSLETIRTDITSNESYAETFIGETWFWQSSTDWVPKTSESGTFPYGELYIGKTLQNGQKGTFRQSGLDFNWKVTEGEKIKGEDTVLLSIKTNIDSEISAYTGTLNYNFELYLSEISSLPLKFKIGINLSIDDFIGSSCYYCFDFKYEGTATSITTGHKEIPRDASSINRDENPGEFRPWENGAPVFGAYVTDANGNGNCGIDPFFALNNSIQKGQEEISDFNTYLAQKKAEAKELESVDAPFVIEAKYNANLGYEMWNFTMAHRSEQYNEIDGWNLEHNYTNSSISGNLIKVNNPILSMDDVPEPLTICSAEQRMTEFEEIASWSENDQTKNVDYSRVELRLGQNLVSKQSLSSPISVINLGSFDILSMVSDLSQGNFNPNDYSNNIDVNTAGSYAYFLDNKGTDHNGNSYQKLAGVDAKDGLVLFNIQSINSN